MLPGTLPTSADTTLGACGGKTAAAMENEIVTNEKPALETVEPPAGRSLGYHMYTIWLVTYSDIKTIICPSAAFAVFSSLAGPVLTTTESPHMLAVFTRLPLVVLWVWINLLPLDLGNQRQPGSIDEDALNKGWRPIPAGRITAQEATRLMFGFYAAAVGVSFLTGGLGQCLALMFMCWLYNDLGGADKSWFTRNLLNALGFMAFTSGAYVVSAGQQQLRPVAYVWLLIVGAVVLTTIHAQDLYDQEGDSMRDRKTFPLVLGDAAARWTVCGAMAFWSLFCPAFWALPPSGFVSPAAVGCFFIGRTLTKKTAEDDRFTFIFWNVWMVLLYLLPLVKRLDFAL